jgi:hypothetical protein
MDKFNMIYFAVETSYVCVAILFFCFLSSYASKKFGMFMISGVLLVSLFIAFALVVAGSGRYLFTIAIIFPALAGCGFFLGRYVKKIRSN